ncbi:hypothetical protein HLB44_04970 [Aquincola sp. S2]|uniref:Ribbon-helix-helix protein CopG domain-containing protein n=1 Tax=Pseudaquabacterium terrae TaxID=2732868 RepID=A0ABX2EBP2_9BURK|nr:CopG family transcriptional regulator [Aquabacterium terrae]NRF66330.1 hypothetical protein [Aquabacterium terrae]
MTLTVRLDGGLEAALERYCAERGVTKSLVVQESLAAYLVAAASEAVAGATPVHAAEPSANYRALSDAGLIGAVALGTGADKAAVRLRVRERAARRRT